MISGRFSEQGRKNYVYSTALRSGKWADAIRALQDGAQAGYVDPYTGRLDIEMARKGNDNSRGIVSVLEKIYCELATQPQAAEIVGKIVDEHTRGDALFASRVASKNSSEVEVPGR
jgi:hypothetical protein